MWIGRGRAVGPALRWSERIVGVISLFAGAFSKAKAEDFYEPLQAPLRNLQSGWVIPVLLVIAPLLAFMRRRFDSGRLEHVHELLDQMCEKTFKNQNFDLPQHRRVTLFKHRKICFWRFPFFGGFLVPIERSGADTRKTGSIFKVHDNGEKNEGVAGRVWSANSNLYVPNLPEIGGRCDPQALDDYAAKTFYPRNKLSGLDKRPTARALMGIPVQVGNKKWGVIVIDSVRPTFNDRTAREAFQAIAKGLSSQLKGL